MRGHSPFISKAEIKSYLEFRNGSSIVAYYPSSSHAPDTLARSLTVPLLYIDECAFIRHMDKIYGSAQQTLSRAREQAIKNKYPYFILMTSTPNGVEGDGKFFYEYWNNSVDSDILFEESDGVQELWKEEAEDLINNPSKNSFIRVSYHWSEDPMKSQKWYQEQCRELNFDRRKINQELDLVFVGSSNCIFTDEVLNELKPEKSPSKIQLVNEASLDIFDDLDSRDYYLIGVDTASSTTGSFNAIEIFSFKNFMQIGEFHERIGSLTRYGQIVDDLFRKLRFHVNDRIILCIENNSIGKAVIEHLMYHVHDIDYLSYLFKEPDKKDYGINTNTFTRELMISSLYELINDNPKRIKSSLLASHLSIVERTASGRINCSDTFMAASFCAYVRKKKILDIMPQIDISDREVERNTFNTFKSVINMSNPRGFEKKESGKKYDIFSNIMTTEQDANLSTNFIEQEEFSMFFPIFDER